MNAATLLILVCAATAAWADLTIRVVDPSGAVVQGAAVVLRSESGSEVAPGTTAASGVAEFSEHVAAAEIPAEGFRAETVSTSGQHEVTVRLQLAPVTDVLDVFDESDRVAPVASDSVEPDRLARAGLVDGLRATPHVRIRSKGRNKLRTGSAGAPGNPAGDGCRRHADSRGRAGAHGLRA